jgi:hypothetical protein
MEGQELDSIRLTPEMRAMLVPVFKVIAERGRLYRAYKNKQLLTIPAVIASSLALQTNSITNVLRGGSDANECPLEVDNEQMSTTAPAHLRC